MNRSTYKYSVLTILTVVFFFAKTTAQEIAIPLAQLDKPQTKILTKEAKASLAIPFFDDFSAGINTTLWDNKGVSVSMTGAVNPPSIGAAMFDAVDNNGDFYAQRTAVVTPSDTLSSLAINLDYPTDNSVYLSFAYEAKGFLDAPEADDSLVLQFYNPSTTAWYTVWKAQGTNPQEPAFKQVIINISGDYLQDGFRFRFINYTSLGNGTPSLVSDCDYWFVDYVYLDRNRFASDTVFSDVALTYPTVFRLDNYTAMPYDHYRQNYQNIDHNYIIKLRNNDAVPRTIDSLYIVFADRNNVMPDDTLYLGSYSFPAEKDFTLPNDNINFNFPLSYSSLPMDMTTKLVTDASDPAGNNVHQGIFDLDNYYAYDDGTAEMGYGLVGDGTFEAMVAAKFVTYKDDFLRGVKIYFNKTYDDNQPRYFYLMVWENDPETGLPGELIYQKQGAAIDFDNRDAYQTFVIDTDLQVTDTFYIGWMKTDEQLMNVGLDITNPAPQYKYYNLNGYWEKSSIEGNLMVRPVFGEILSSTEETVQNIKLYPNPAYDRIYLDIQQQSKVYIYDMYGRTVKETVVWPSEAIDISSLAQGIYILKIVKNGKVYTQKFIKK